MNANKKQTTDKTRSRAIFRVFWALLGLFALLWQSAAAQVTPDEFEVDNTPQETNFLFLNEPHGPHNFHEAGDEDWVRLVKIQGQAENNPYSVFFDTNLNLDPVWELFNSAGERLDKVSDSEFNWPTTGEDFFFIKITHEDSTFSGDATYTIQIDPSPIVSTVVGIVRNIVTGEPLPGVTITVQDTGVSTTSKAGGNVAGLYVLTLADINQPPQNYTLKANRDGFVDAVETVSNVGKFAVEHNILLQPKSEPAEPDGFEVDNTPQEANFLFLAEPHGPHNFHEAGDEDWVRLVKIQGQAEDNPYTVEFFDTNLILDPVDLVWELFNSAGEPLDKVSDLEFNWPTTGEDFFFIKITHKDSTFSGNATYTIEIDPSPIVSTVIGIVRNKDTAEPLPGVTITVEETGISTISKAGGNVAGLYVLTLADINQPPQDYTLKANRDGFVDADETVSNAVKSAVEHNILLQPESKPNPDPDLFESNDTPVEASEIIVDSSSGVFRNFHDEFDVDWIKFVVPLSPDLPDQAYKILVQTSGGPVPNWFVFESDGITELLNHTQGNTFQPPRPPEAFYLVKLENSDTSKLGADTAYTIQVIAIKTKSTVLPIGALQLLLLD